MESKRTRILFTAALAFALGGARAAQVSSNDVPLNNGGDVVFLYSSPSVGGATGTNPPDLAGDLYWKAYAGDRLLFHQTALGTTVEIDGYYESVYDTDWMTPSSFYDRSHGPALPGASGTLEPAFFQMGWTSETLVSLGSTGIGSPCSIAPSLCSPSGGTCPVPGYITGYLIDIHFGSTSGSGIVIPAGGTPASDHAITWFLPGDMVATGGVCHLGDYVLQDVHSTDETMAAAPSDYNSPYGGFQIRGFGPVPELVASTAEAHPTFRHRMLNLVAQTSSATGIEKGDNGGGATNALRLSVSSGSASIRPEIRSLADAGTSNLAALGASWSTLPAPGIDVLGARLLLVPLPILSHAAAMWNGSVLPKVFVFTDEGAFEGLEAPIPAVVAGLDLYLQGFVLDLGAAVAANTNVWRTSFLP